MRISDPADDGLAYALFIQTDANIYQKYIFINFISHEYAYKHILTYILTIYFI